MRPSELVLRKRIKLSLLSNGNLLLGGKTSKATLLSVVHRGIKFSQWVGVLRVGSLTIEISLKPKQNVTAVPSTVASSSSDGSQDC